MSLKTIHPKYNEYIDQQVTCRDLYGGEHVVKAKNEEYLPATSGMRLDGMQSHQDGYKDYMAYKKRALLPAYFEDAVNTRMGLLYQKLPIIELPTALEYLLEDCDGKGTSLISLMRLISLNQLVVGRIGLALDPGMDNRLRIVTYEAETILNWADNESALDFVVLDETGYEMDASRNWSIVEKFRLMTLFRESETSQALYASQVERAGNLDSVLPMTHKLIGNTLDQVPFVIINSKDCKPDPDKPPLSGLSSLVLAIYRGEADYRHNLFMQGQDTLVTIGTVTNNQMVPTGDGQEAIRTGAGSRIAMELNGDAKYIGVNSAGLSEQREALTADRTIAESKSGELVNVSSSGVESNEALETRIASRTVTLNDIAITGAVGLTNLLRIAAKWSGLNPAEVVVTPNLDFSKETLTGAELKEYTEVNIMGGPISKRTIHELMRKKEVTTLTYEEEQRLIEEERANNG